VITIRAPRIMDVDSECRPLSYLGSDFTTSEITAIAWGFNHESDSRIRCTLLGRKRDGGTTQQRMFDRFVAAWEEADIVTGHFLLLHDLPLFNGALLELNRPPLSAKFVSDTKVHLIGGKGVSKSQESLGDIFHTTAPKIPMSQAKWRDANRLTASGLAETRKRVVGDVIQHRQLRTALIANGSLKPPVLWSK
jgi:hypothetical protein